MPVCGEHRAWRWFALPALSVLAFLLVPVASPVPVSAQSDAVAGIVRSDTTALEDFTVTLFATNGTGPATALGSDTTLADGSFSIAFTPPAAADSVLYLRAENQTSPPAAGTVALVAVLGTGSPPAGVVITELTTVAAAYAMAQFTEGGDIRGPAPGGQNAASMAANMADVTTGQISSVLDTLPNGVQTEGNNSFNSLGNVVATCVNDDTQCPMLFAATTPPGGVAPTDTFQAMVDLAHFPNDIDHPALFALSQDPPAAYAPVRGAAPDAWTMAIRFHGDGVSMAGPGNFAIDHEGNLWVANNYEFSLNPLDDVCGAKSVLKFLPNGEYAPGSPFFGGGVNGVGYGIDIDPFGDIWLGNFGFAAPTGCGGSKAPPHNTLSQFRPDGTPVSPSATATSPGGWTSGTDDLGIFWPQGTVSDDEGNIWAANCNNGSVTQFPGGDPGRGRSFGDIGLTHPFDIAFDNEGTAFISDVGGHAMAMLDVDGNPRPGSPTTVDGQLARPMGVASDDDGNIWVANSGLVDIPCPQANLGSGGGSISLVREDGSFGANAFTGGGLVVPWGISTDGDGNVWISNFAQKRLSHFCGADPSTCPPGLTTGDPISPANGYSFDGLVRNTAAQVDPSGNVWVSNNWKDVPIQSNPPGYQIVAFVGLAEPKLRPAPIPRPTTPITPSGPIAARPAFTG